LRAIASGEPGGESPLKAKKSSGQGRADLPVGQDARRRVPTTRQKPSALVDTRVIYCGDNLEHLNTDGGFGVNTPDPVKAH
jgi:hypothetical protein